MNGRARRAPAAEVRRALDRLMALRGQPGSRAEHATAMLALAPNAEALLAAGRVLAEEPYPAAHDALIAAHEAVEAVAGREDRGGAVRAALVRALTPIVERSDVPLLLRVAATFDGSQGGCCDLRAAAVVALLAADAEVAGFAAGRLLGDHRHAAPMTGEPAVSAARVLGALGNSAALLTYLFRDRFEGPAEVAAECLRELRGVPESVLAELVSVAFAAAVPELTVRLGFCDLVLGHEPSPVLGALARTLLGREGDDELYEYFVRAIVAANRQHLVAVLREHAERVPPGRRQTLAEALSYARGQPELIALAEQLRAGP